VVKTLLIKKYVVVYCLPHHVAYRQQST